MAVIRCGQFCLRLLLMSSIIYTCKGSMVTFHAENLTWFESMKKCQLATKDDIGDNSIQNKGWIGGMYRMTEWMYHEGCYFDKYKLSVDGRQEQFSDNSPSRCSINCNNFTYFGLTNDNCICIHHMEFNVDSLQKRDRESSCTLQCPGSKSSDITCGSTYHGLVYLDMYKHLKDLTVMNSRDTANCVTVESSGQHHSVLVLRAVNCLSSFPSFCLDSQGQHYLFSQRKRYNDAKSVCKLLQNKTGVHIPQGRFWTGIERHNIFEWIKMDGAADDGRTTGCLTIENGRMHIMNCTQRLPYFCSNDTSKRIISTDLTALDHASEILSTSSIGIHISQTTVAAFENTAETPYQTYVPSTTETPYQTFAPSITETPVQTLVPSTTETLYQTFSPTTKGTKEARYHTSVPSVNTTLDNTVNATSDTQTDIPPTDIFAIQIGVAACICLLVIFLAVLARLIGKSKRCQNIFSKPTSEDNDLIPDQKGKSHHKKTEVKLADNYTLAWDTTTPKRVQNGLLHECVDNDATYHHTVETNREETSEYNHLDFTLRSTNDKKFADDIYSRTGPQVNSVFDQPWDGQGSTVQKLFSQMGQSIRKNSKDIRNSLFKRQSSRNGENIAVNKQHDEHELQQQNLLYDSPSLNRRKPIATSNGKNAKQTEVLFPVLPISERLEVKSTHIYAEPEDRCTSLGERIIRIFSTTNVKLPWGIDLRTNRPISRARSRIYSLAKTIEETDESEV